MNNKLQCVQSANAGRNPATQAGSKPTRQSAPADGAGIDELVDNILAGFSAFVAGKDMWWPDGSWRKSRGIMTHEYGHFAMCSMLFEEEGANGLTGLLARVFAGPLDRDNDEALMLEGMADLFAMQAAGGTNYVPILERSLSRDVSYCVASPCLDGNWQGNNTFATARAMATPGSNPVDPFRDELARWETFMFDVFDGFENPFAGGRTSQRLNADYWILSPNGLAFAPTGFINNDDEGVTLAPTAWKTWIKNWIEHGLIPDTNNVLRGLADTMVDRDVNWCDRCEVSLIHSESYTSPDAFVPTPPAGALRTFAERHARWVACLTDRDAFGVGALGAGRPSDPYLNVDANCMQCEPLHFADPANGGACTACPAGQVARGDHCELCPLGTAARANNECSPCEADEISVGGACVPCGFGQGAAPDGQSCTACDLDDTVDFHVGTSRCSPFPAALLGSAPGDNCPDVHVVDVVNFDPPVTENGFVTVFPEGNPSEAICSTILSHVAVAFPDGAGGFEPPAERTTPGVFYDTCPAPGEDACSPDTGECLICDQDCLAFATVRLDGADIALHGNTVRVAAQVTADGSTIPAIIRVSESTGGGVSGLCQAR